MRYILIIGLCCQGLINNAIVKNKCIKANNSMFKETQNIYNTNYYTYYANVYTLNQLTWWSKFNFATGGIFIYSMIMVVIFNEGRFILMLCLQRNLVNYFVVTHVLYVQYYCTI